jgi:hypothetical protein
MQVSKILSQEKKSANSNFLMHSPFMNEDEVSSAVLRIKSPNDMQIHEGSEDE